MVPRLANVFRSENYSFCYFVEPWLLPIYSRFFIINIQLQSSEQSCKKLLRMQNISTLPLQLPSPSYSLIFTPHIRHNHPAPSQNLKSDEQDKQAIISTICASDNEDSAVSFQENILNEHLYCVRVKTKKITNYLFLKVSYDLLEKLSQEQGWSDRTDLMTYIINQQSLLSSCQIAYFERLLLHQSNFNQFLQEVLQSAPEILVHELIFVALQVMKFHRHCWDIPRSIEELQFIASSVEFIKLVCSHPQLQWLHYQFVLGSRGIADVEIKQEVANFLYFYLFTILLVCQKYFINPYFEVLKPKRRQIQDRKKGTRKGKKIIRKKRNLANTK